MTTPCVDGKVAFKVHLPQRVGLVMLEAMPGLCGLAGLGADQAAALQNRIDSAGGQLDLLVPPKHMGDLASSPSRMLASHLDHGLLKPLGRDQWRCLGPPRSICQISSGLLAASQPLVAGLATDLKSSA